MSEQNDTVTGVAADPVFGNIPEADIFSAISSRCGRAVASWDDLKQMEREIPASYASDEVGVLDKYVRETGRGISDYITLQKDWKSVPDHEAAEAYLKKKHPSFSPDEIRELMALDFEDDPVNDEDMDERTIQNVRQGNKRRAFALKAFADEGRSVFEKEKDLFRTPERTREDAFRSGQEEWNDSMKKAIDGLDAIRIGDFEYRIEDKGPYSHLSDLQKMMDSFKENGQMNHQRLARTIITGLEAEKILSKHAGYVEENTRKNMTASASNKDGGLNREHADIEEWKQKNINKLRSERLIQ